MIILEFKLQLIYQQNKIIIFIFSILQELQVTCIDIILPLKNWDYGLHYSEIAEQQINCVIIQKYTYLITQLMNIIAQQLNSKPTTQSMLVSFLQDMKQYFKKAPFLSEDKTYNRIFKIAQTTEKYVPHFYCFTNIATQLIKNLRMKVDDKFEDNKAEKLNQSNTNDNNDEINNQDVQALNRIHSRLSKEKEGSTFNRGRQVNQQFMRKLVIDSIDDARQQIGECENIVSQQLQHLLENQISVLFFDSHLSNKSIVSKIAESKKLNIKYVKMCDADTKNNQINLTDVASQVRKAHKVIISVESILKNGAVIANSGALMVALAAKKYSIPVIIVGRGFSLTQKNLIDQHVLLAQNPMKYFKKTEGSTLKVFVGKRFDLIESKLVSQIVTELGTVNPSSLQLFFMTHYDYS